MTTLVTGAAGKHVVAELVRRGEQVRALLGDGHAGRAYNLTGPESLTPRERIAVLSKAIGREIAFVPIGHEQAIERLTVTGVPRADAEYVICWCASPDAASTTVVDTVARVTGRPARTFAQWVDEHAQRFRPARVDA